MKLLSTAALLLMGGLLSAPSPSADDEPSWEAILQRPGEPIALPIPRPKLEWLGSLEEGLLLADKEQRPLFVTARCLPCKQCADFDKSVLEAGGELDPWLRQFVTVRLTDAALLDLRLLPIEGYQDLDLSWWGYLLSPEGSLYAIFGGRDEVSDTTRISVKALVNTLRRVLSHHYDPRRADWGIDRDAPSLEGRPRTVRQLPGWRSWSREAKELGACVHCHQVAEVLRQPAIEAGTFDTASDLDMWPLPENVGIALDRDHGLRVMSVEEDSPATKAGLRPGDVLAAADGQRLFGQADFRGVLHRGPKGSGEVAVVWKREDAVHRGRLALEDGWRQTVLDWRMSVSQGNIGAGPGFFPLAARGRRQQRGIEDGTLAIEPYAPRGAAQEAGLRGSDIVIAVDDQKPDLFGRAFLVWFRRRYEPGQEIRLTVRDPRGEDREIRYVLE
ncbi:MAG: PDZ domain-containing protein [Planctomycetota bacterium]